MDYRISLPFNPKPSTKLHIDLNSCFASIEQQANPKLRGKPIAVAAIASDYGCILAPSREAKEYGIKTGMRVREAKELYPRLIVLPPDPWKYRNVHLSLRKLLNRYTDRCVPKSIDEFVLDLEGVLSLRRISSERLGMTQRSRESDNQEIWNSDISGTPSFSESFRIIEIAREIKQRIKSEVGDWLTVSIGIAPNRFLAKVGAGLHKPDGLDEINKENYLKVYSKLELTDLYGIASHNARRLNRMGIYSVLDFYNAPVWKIKGAFESIVAFDWFSRLRGFEADEVEFRRRSYGNSFAMPGKYSDPRDLAPILQKLVEKMGFRFRKAGYKAQGVHVSLSFIDFKFWHHGEKTERVLFDSREIYKLAYSILCRCPEKKPVRVLAVSVFNLVTDSQLQLGLFEDLEKRQRVVEALDTINERWGSFVVTPAGMMGTAHLAPDRIAFGGIKELEEFTLSK